jgi:hypothetical protein
VKLAIADIRVGQRLRTLRDNVVADLMGSIQAIGLQNPITVMVKSTQWRGGGPITLAYELIAGHHRLVAMERLGHREIDCWVIGAHHRLVGSWAPTSSLFSATAGRPSKSTERLGRREIDSRIIGPEEAVDRLYEIDENLIRAELSQLERGEHMLARKTLYEAAGLHQPLRYRLRHRPLIGYDGATLCSAPFVDATAERMGVAATRVRRDVRRAEKIDRKIRERIRGRLEIADNGKELDALAGMTAANQKRALDLVEAGKVTTVRQAGRLLSARNADAAAPPNGRANACE